MRQIFTILILMISSFCFSQEFEVTQDGIKDKSNINNNFLVIEAENYSANRLYQNALKFIIETYKNPDYVIKGKIENEYIRFESNNNFSMSFNNKIGRMTATIGYAVELRFKDGKVRYEIISLKMPVAEPRNLTFKGSIWSGYPIFNDKGEVRLPEAKEKLENHLNELVSLLKSFLLETETKQDKW